MFCCVVFKSGEQVPRRPPPTLDFLTPSILMSLAPALCHLSRLLQGDAVRWLLTIVAGPQQFEALSPEAAGNKIEEKSVRLDSENSWRMKSDTVTCFYCFRQVASIMASTSTGSSNEDALHWDCSSWVPRRSVLQLVARWIERTIRPRKLSQGPVYRKPVPKRSYTKRGSTCFKFHINTKGLSYITCTCLSFLSSEYLKIPRNHPNDEVNFQSGTPTQTQIRTYVPDFGFACNLRKFARVLRKFARFLHSDFRTFFMLHYDFRTFCFGFCACFLCIMISVRLSIIQPSFPSNPCFLMYAFFAIEPS